MTIRVEIVDLGFNNLGSLVSAFVALEVPVRVIRDRSDSRDPALLVLPGTGTFSGGMNSLEETGIGDLLVERHNSMSTNLGICLGMQLLGNGSDESPGYSGLGIFNASSRLLEATDFVPNIGWSKVTWKSGSQSRAIDWSSPMYFMHSFAMNAEVEAEEVGVVHDSGRSFAAFVRISNTLGVQFHPEKSSKAGLRFLRRVLEVAIG